MLQGLYRNLLRPILFTQDSEAAHEFTLHSLAWCSRHTPLRELTASLCQAPRLPVSCFGLDFPNPVGLAAGMDKKADALPMWECLGFGFSELGGVTRHAQPGNPKPRMFRALADEALVNRMGFNNPGANAFAETLQAWQQASLWPHHPVGVNLGKSKVTPLEEATQDYATSFQSLRQLADFFVVNVSSPNTPNLRQLQDKDALKEIFSVLQEINHEGSGPKPKPILLKVAPDLTWEALDDILELVPACQVAGIVACNTTITRPDSRDPSCQAIYRETGGLSGRPLQTRSTEIIRYLHETSQGKVPIIGVGGIFSVEDAWEKITAGASLVQVYTGLVYQGPGLVGDLVRGLHRKLREHGLDHLSQAVGLRTKVSAAT